MFLHFEMIPDRLPDGLRALITQFPPGALQFEVGIQTFDEATSRNISRRNNHLKTAENFAFLRTETGVHIHADLIVGLPGEAAESFGAGFDRLYAMGPQEIQVGILKRLRGTPIMRHDAEYSMIYAPQPPYEILQNNLISFTEMQHLRRFAKYWDLIGNSGNFTTTLPLILAGAASAYERMRALSDSLYASLGASDSVALMRLSQLIFLFLTERLKCPPTTAASHLWQDYTKGRVADQAPAWLAQHLPKMPRPADGKQSVSLPTRQGRHRS
jgi:hypothetical protein